MPIERFLSTPQGPRDLYLAQQDIQKLEGLGRRTQLLLQKAGKAFAAANARAAGLEAEKKRLQHELQATSSRRTRKRVQIDPNQRFAEVENIVGAIRAAEALEAQQQRATVASALERAAIATAAIALQSMCTQWQL